MGNPAEEKRPPPGVAVVQTPVPVVQHFVQDADVVTVPVAPTWLPPIAGGCSWLTILIFALPLVSRALHLPAGVGGAWIGTSEFADAAGLAAAQSYGGLAGSATGIPGTPDQALASYTLIKVIGRDVWIGIWAFVLAFIAVTRWDGGFQDASLAPDQQRFGAVKALGRNSEGRGAGHRPGLCRARLDAKDEV